MTWDMAFAPRKVLMCPAQIDYAPPIRVDKTRQPSERNRCASFDPGSRLGGVDGEKRMKALDGEDGPCAFRAKPLI
jgi:hypothetical protein